MFALAVTLNRVYAAQLRKNHWAVLVACVLTVGMVACSGNSPTAPTPPPPPPAPACQTNNTAMLTFINGTNLTLTVRLDGSIIGTLGPGQSSPPQTVAAGVQHRDEFVIANTGLIACSGTPVLAQCANNTLTCAP